MSGTFTATTDVARNLIRYRLAGFFDAADLPAICAQRSAAHAALQCPPNEHVTLCDVSGCKLQAQDVVAMFGHLIGKSEYRARRLAVVVGESLVRMQLRRLIAGEPERIAVFPAVLAAEHWLLRPETARAA